MCESREHAFAREKELVTEETLADPMCMNLGLGGVGSAHRVYGATEETRRKISEKGKAAWAEGRHTGNIGKTASPETIAKRVAKLAGQKRTEEQAANISKGLQSYHQTVDQEVIIERAQRGLKTRIERGTNIGGRPKGTPMSEEQKARQSALTKGKALSEAHKAALKKPKTRICCLFCRSETTTNHLPRYHVACA